LLFFVDFGLLASILKLVNRLLITAEKGLVAGIGAAAG
jgi:hypothetical protein